ncbi:DUF2911 domain-containing protein [Panacibacter ginsenosidivorans]|uniref:DUF2911 domain-containing protein n=1 Tax=Panacibacter ginsenosidivorans TaxID=1813871 RepID=A0A5B8VEA3_9BACT|nr:DUF2911 domain-containing protein [Panacibacter ginsenosidivorans]QEC69847.1 DUF2911 domain-containing protein [Panacibacter ginsenosidivorans]
MKKKLAFAVALSAFFVNVYAQELRTPQPSPTEEVKQNFGLSSIELSYSRPGMKGRTIFGDLVPYGKVWRTGANSATTLTFGDDVTIGDTKVPAGKYGLLTIPDASQWTVIITKQLDVTSPAAYKQDQDVVRIKITPQTLPFSVETFTMLFGNIKSSSITLGIMWDNVYVELPISTDIDSKVSAQIKEIMDGDNKPYFQAALYYIENGKDLNQAVAWLDKAIAQNPDAFYMYYQKARALAKLGKKTEALAVSNKSRELSIKAKSDDYVALNDKLQKELK